MRIIFTNRIINEDDTLISSKVVNEEISFNNRGILNINNTCKIDLKNISFVCIENNSYSNTPKIDIDNIYKDIFELCKRVLKKNNGINIIIETRTLKVTDKKETSFQNLFIYSL